MKKQFFLIGVAIVLAIQVSAHSDSTFYYLDKSELTNNVLCSFNDTVYWGIYNGVNDAEFHNLFPLQILSDLNYLTFGHNEKPEVEALKLTAAQDIRENIKIPIFIIHYEYTRIKSNALSDSLITLDEGKYYDVIPRPEEPYETDVIFVAAPLKEKIFSGQQTFFISRDYFVTNLPDPTSIEIDFDDGLGYQAVTFEQTITIEYSNSDKKLIKTKISYNNNIFIAKSTSAAEFCQGSILVNPNGYPLIDEHMFIYTTIPFSSPSTYTIQSGDGQSHDPNNGYTEAKVYIKYGNGHPVTHLVKPLIFIEGIDFGYEAEFKGFPQGSQVIRYGDVGWCEFWGQSYNINYPNDYLYGNVEFKHSPAFLYALLAQGYDIMLVDFRDGADFIQRNAMVIVELLNKIQDRQATGGYAHQPSVIIGASMGGQVGKYALSYMEQTGMKHCTRNYISFDSPHQGANIPLSLQQWLNFFSFNGAGGGNEDIKKDYNQRIPRPATRQLLVRQIYSGGIQDRNAFQNTMNNMGYPQKLRKVAIASGSKFGTTQQYLAAGQQILHTHWSPAACLGVTFIKGDCYTTGSSLSFAGKAPKNGAIACLFSTPVLCPICAAFNLFDNATLVQQTPPVMPLWDNAPGGNRNTAEFIAKKYNDEIKVKYFGIFGGHADANPTSQPATPRESFIPTISALDVFTNNLTLNINSFIDPNIPEPQKYPFDAYYASATNQPHVQLENMSFGVNSNLDWGFKEILNSQPNLPFVLDGSSPNAGVYNMARHANRFLSSVTIGNGGSLYFNANLPSDFGASTVPMPPGGTPPPLQGSTLYVEACDCNNIVIDVQSGGEFILGDNTTSNKAIVTLRGGTSFYLRSGSVLRVREGSQLILTASSHFYWEPGAEIILEGPNSLIDIQSENTDIVLNSGDAFWLHKGTAQQGGTIQFHDGTFIMNSGSQLLNNHCKINLFVNVYFSWQNGAQLILEDSEAFLDVHYPSTSITLQPTHTFHIQKGNAQHGGGVEIRGGTITMNSGSTIHAEGFLVLGKDNTFNYNAGANIICEFDQSFVQFHGVINVNDAEFTFTGDGSFKFGLPKDWNNYTNIHTTGNNAKITFQGNDPTDIIVSVFDDSWISNIPAPFTIRNGTVQMGKGCWIGTAGDVVLQDIIVRKLDPNSTIYHEGIYLNGQPNHLVNNIEISGGKYGLRCRNFFGGASITIKNSLFHNNILGVRVFDKGLKFENCTFINNGDAGWHATDMTFNSRAVNCNVSFNGDGSYFETSGSANLILDKCNYEDNSFWLGASFAGSNSFIIKCGSYSRNYAYGLKAYYNSDLILSPTLANGAGKAKININSISNIMLGVLSNYNNPLTAQNAVSSNTAVKSLFLESGYNQLVRDLTGGEYNYPGHQLFGKVRECLNINNNQWEISTPGNISSYNLFGYWDCPGFCYHWELGMPCEITWLTDNNPKMRPECWVRPDDDTPVELRGFIEYCPECPSITSENFNNVPLNEAFVMALNTTTEFDTLDGDNALAFDMFYDIVQFGFTQDRPVVKQIQSLAYNRMKNLLVELGESNPEILSQSSEQLAKSMEMAETFITIGREFDDDILEYHSYLDKANFQYLSSDRNAAIQTILRIPSCVRLDSSLTAFANQRLCFYNAVEQVLAGGQHVMRFDSIMNYECYINLRSGIGEAAANIDTVIYSVTPILSSSSIIDNTGNTYTATAIVDSSINFSVVKTLANQNQDWQFSLDGWNENIDSAKVITADAAGYIYAAGKAWNGYEFNLVTAKLNTEGEPVWTAFYNFPNFDATPVGITVDGNFIVSVYVEISDSSTSDYALIKYSQCDTSCVARVGNIFENVPLSNSFVETFSFYPNPANDLLTVEYRLNGNNNKFRLMDMTGRIVVNEELNNNETSKQINISHLNSGIYSVVILTGDKIQQVNKLAILR